MRKLGPEDRLVGGAKLALEYGVFPMHLCRAIAAGLKFDPPGDPTASKLQEMLRSKGLRATLEVVSGLGEDSPLTAEIVRQYDLVAEEFRCQTTLSP